MPAHEPTPAGSPLGSAVPRGDAAASALRQLRDVRATIFGSVLNNVAAQDAGQGYGGYYYYQGGYYGQDAEEADLTGGGADQHAAAADQWIQSGRIPPPHAGCL